MKKKGIVIISIVVLLLGAIAFGLTKNALSINSVNKLETNTSYTTEQQKNVYGVGDWELTASWTNPLNKTNTDITGNFVHVTANTNSMSEINLDYNISLSYTGNTAETGFYERDAYLALPLDSSAFPFLTVDSIFDYDWDINNDTGIINAYKTFDGTDEKVLFATIDLKGIPNIENATDTDEIVWEFVDDGRKYEIEIFNHLEIDTSQDYTMEFSINYSALPSLLVNYENDMANNFAPRVILTQQNRCFINDVTRTAISEKLEVENIVPVPLNTEDSIIYTEWQNTWGTNPDPSGSYIYAYFEYDASIVGSRQFNNSSYSDNVFAFTPAEGELIAYGDGTTFKVGNLTAFNTDSTPVEPSNDYNVSTYAKIGNEIPTTTDFIRQFIVRYPNTGDEIDTSATLTISLKPDTNDDPVVTSYTWPVYYEPSGGLNDLYPTEDYNEVKVTGGYDSGIGIINRINNNKEAPLDFFVSVDGTTSPDMNKAEDGSGYSHYTSFNNYANTNKGKNDYTFELVTDKVELSDGTNITQTNDYSIKRILASSIESYDYVELVDHIGLHQNEEHPTFSLYAKIGEEDWVKLGEYTKSSTNEISFNSMDNRVTTSLSGGLVDVYLPDNTKAVKTVYTGKNAAIDIGYDIGVSLTPTDAIKEYVNSHDEVLIKTTSKTVVNNNIKDTADYSRHIYKLDSRTDTSLTSNVVKTNDSNIISYTYDITESIDYNDETRQYAETELIQQYASHLNVLLPEGGTIENIAIKDINGNDVTFNTQSTVGFNNSNRDLVDIEILNGGYGSNIKEENDSFLSGYHITFDTKYPHLSNREYGNIVNLDLAYYNPSGMTDGYTSSSNADTSNFTSTDAKTILSALTPASNNSYSFDALTNTVDPVSSDTVTVTSGAFTTTNQEYLTQNSVKMGTKYKYKISLNYTDPLTEISNVQFFDPLDEAYGSDTNHWQGTFNSIDVSALEDLGITPTIYYSTNEGLVWGAGSSPEQDLSRRDIWTEYDEAVTDKTTIKAIAVDCGDYVFMNGEKPSIIIEMIASLNSNEKGYKAYNRPTVSYLDLGITTYYNTNQTEIELEDLSLDLTVTPKKSLTGGSYENGNETNYDIIDGTINYLYTLNNYEDMSLENIQFETKITGITSNTIDEIQVYRGTDPSTAVSLSSITDGSITLTEENGKMIFTISELAAGEAVNIYIPHYIDINDLDNENYKIESVSSIIRINNRAYKGDDIKTYHKISIPLVEAGHSTKAIKTYNVFSSEKIYVTKGETITHMIKVSNSGDVIARNVLIEEQITNGTVVTDSITNGGVFENGKITWTIDVEPGSFVDLTYNLQIPNEVENNTYFTPTTSIKLANPYDANIKLIDENLSYGDIVYRKTSDIIIHNSVEGALADQDKKFKYTITVEGPADYAGEYDAGIGEDNGSTNGHLIIDSTGHGTFEADLKNGWNINLYNIPQGMSYTITKTNYAGYKNTVSGYGYTEPAIVEEVNITGTLEGEEGELRTFNILNTYSASTSVTPAFKTTYDKELEEGMFTVNFQQEGTENPLQSVNNLEGNVTFDPIVFMDEVGTYRFTVSEVTGDNIRIKYDENTYTMVVKVTDNQTGTLQKQISYYDSSNKRVDEIIFKNTFIKVGLMVSNTHLGDYINPDKAFKYKIRISGAAPNSEYIVTNQDGEELDKLTTDANGDATYNVELKHDEFIVIEELPLNTDYSVEETLDKYYEAGMKGLDGELDEEENILVYEGTIGLEVTKVMFTNKYETAATFAPKANIELQDKTLENSEFTFRITDVSDGVTNGYTEEVTNDVDGNILFTSINFTRPGTYQYEIELLNNNEPNITYDNTKLLLTLVLTDNEDGTMKVESTYKYLNNLGKFLNVYSKEPLPPIVEEGAQKNIEPEKVNPNTRDSAFIISIIGIIALLFVYAFRKYKLSKLMKN